MNTYEPIILKKLGLSERFPKKILYTRKTTLGIGIMKPLAILVILALKLYIGYNRLDISIAKIIRINKEIAQIQYGCINHSVNTPKEHKLMN